MFENSLDVDQVKEAEKKRSVHDRLDLVRTSVEYSSLEKRKFLMSARTAAHSPTFRAQGAHIQGQPYATGMPVPSTNESDNSAGDFLSHSGLKIHSNAVFGAKSPAQSANTNSEDISMEQHMLNGTDPAGTSRRSHQNQTSTEDLSEGDNSEDGSSSDADISDISTCDIWEAFQATTDQPCQFNPTSRVVVKLSITDQHLLAMARHLKMADLGGLIFYTVDLNPTREQMELWLKKTVEDPLGVAIIHLKMLERRHFLVIFKSAAEKEKVMAHIPYHYNNRQIVVLQWERRYNPAKIKKIMAPVWVNLQYPDYIFEDLALDLLQTIGPVSYLTGIEKAGGKFPHIWGLVLLDLRKPLPSCVEVEWLRESRHLNIVYENLPDCCFNCGSRSHHITLCPQERYEEVDRRPQAPRIATDEEGFQVVNRRRPRRPPQARNPPAVPQGSKRPDRIIPVGAQEESDDEEETLPGGNLPQQASPPSVPLQAPIQNADPGENTTPAPHDLNTGPLDFSGASLSNPTSAASPVDGNLDSGDNCSASHTNCSRNGPSRSSKPDGRRRSCRGKNARRGRATEKGGSDSPTQEKSSPAPGKGRNKKNQAKSQELKANKERVLFNLGLLQSGATIIHDQIEEKKGGAALLVSSRITITASGTKGDGPWYTSQQIRGDKIELSRLDRLYISNGGEWIHGSAEERHIASMALSDHFPVEVLINLEQPQTKRMRGTYTKLQTEAFNTPESLLELKEKWSAIDSDDPRIKWCLAWKEAAKMMRAFSSKQKVERRSYSALATDVATLREQIQHGASQEKIEELKIKTVKLREAEEATTWRRRSRAKWAVLGDAPTRYFFSLLKAKQHRESINLLISEKGEIMDEDTEILDHIHEFYSALFSPQKLTTTKRRHRRQVLRLLSKKIPPEANEILERIPDAEEIEDLVKALPKNKAPGADGVTAEMLTLCWPFVGNNCKSIIWAFWNDCQLGHKESLSVIRLLPKNAQKQYLKHWRPISLLTIAYKLIARILANRLKLFLDSIVDVQQTGFVAGWQISDNILALHLAKEVAEKTNQESLFLKLDFVKAFDRVEHQFLRDTMSMMGFGDKFINLVFGLMNNGTAKVHVNGLFTDSIQLGRGVRQGCPIAPMLFAISTQPLMALLRDEERKGRIQGVSVPGGRPFLHQFFADDSGINITASEAVFNRIKWIVKRFENISGALLNLSKSVVIPLSLKENPQWLKDSGRIIAREKELITSLGSFGGVKVSEDQIVDTLLEKLNRKIHHWSSRLLTWPGRLCLLKHALKAIPNYILLTLGLSSSGYNQLETICRSFLWGKKELGSSKTPLIAWDFFALRRDQGGLDIIPFQLQGRALKMRHIARILSGEDVEWASAVRFFLKENVARGTQSRKRRFWSAGNAMLLHPNMRIRYSKTTATLMDCWRIAVKALRFSGPVYFIPATLDFDQLFCLLQRYTDREDICFPKAKPWLKKMGATCLMHLKNGDGSWISLTWLANYKRVNLPHEIRLYMTRLQAFLGRVNTDVSKLEDSPSWHWQTPQGLKPGWSHSTRFWRETLSTPVKVDNHWQQKWSMTDAPDNWNRRWKLIWSPGVPTATTVWFWRLIHRGFFIGSKAKKFGVAEGNCPRFPGTVETLEHLLWLCPGIRTRWHSLQAASTNLQVSMAAANSLLQLIDISLAAKSNNLAPIVVLIELCKVIWTERNEAVFRGVNSIKPLIAILPSCNSLLTIPPGAQLSTTKKLRIETSNTWLDLLIEAVRTLPQHHHSISPRSFDVNLRRVYVFSHTPCPVLQNSTAP
ncbi:hypothetical protein R1sor_025184 [Riccia sorocarpa]|uniref:Reverse transcriptase domain-containing protein n=1 Tax=Riccia sorocarpa TaxID=122646 RepID=A0ABD3GBI0_9MARC